MLSPFMDVNDMMSRFSVAGTWEEERCVHRRCWGSVTEVSAV